MRKLTKMKLKEFNEMTDSEMKSIRGGYDTYSELRDCHRGYTELQCLAICEVEIVYGGKTLIAAGSCHHSGIEDICACVVD